MHEFSSSAIAKVSLLIYLVFSVTACAPEVVRRNNAGNKAFQRGAYEAALVEYRQAQLDEPEKAEPYHNAANAYNRRGQVDAALAQAKQALKTAGPALAAATWYNLGNAYFDARSWLEAIAAYQEALRMDPDDRDAKHNLELALQKLERQREQDVQQPERDQQQRQDREEEQQEDDRGGAENQDRPETDAATPTPVNQMESLEDQQVGAEDQKEAHGMTSEAALHLLQALIEHSETLHERLQEVHRVPSPPPEQDW